MPNKFTITLNWETGRKIERTKFDYESKIKRKLTWDDFFNNFVLMPKNIVKGEKINGK